ncbi:MAG: hypothetical protein CV087_21595 [Candidatus Brocadia sp. WS118]|nr:MAG: hypothetical protein CV087_21595 [Candidatus Brocadia sp. WS118]
MPKVSIVIPYYNGNRFISDALNSIMDQSYSDYEVIIVDDHSNMESYDHLKEVVNNYPIHIKIIRHEQNKGIPSTRNSGILHSTGEYIAFLDQDDVWYKDKLQTQINIFSEYKDIGIVYTDSKINNIKKPYKRKLPNPYDLDFAELKQRIFNYWIFSSCSTLLIRKECFEKKGLFNTELYSGEEIEFAMRIIPDYKIFLIDQPLVNKRKHKSNASNSLKSQLTVEEYLLSKFIEIFPEFSIFKNSRLSKIYSNYAKSYIDVHAFRESAKLAFTALSLNPLNKKIYLLFPYFILQILKYGNSGQ